MARYQVGSSVYELPDNLTEEQLNQTLLELSFELGLAKRDSAFGYGVDVAQELVGTGMEAVGRATGFDTLANAGTSIIEQQKRDMAAGGFKPKYGEDLLYYAGGPNFWGALVEKTLMNAPSGGAALVGTGLTAAASVAGMPIVALGLGLGTTAGTFLMGTGEAAKEQLDKTGQYSPEVSTALGVVIGILDRAGARGVIPVERLAQMSVKEVAEELGQKGFVNAAQEVTKRAAKKAGIEGSTEVAQEATSVAGAATQGAEYTPRELAGRAFEAGTLGATLGGGTSVTVDAAKGVGNAVSSAMDARIEGNDSAAAGDFARDLQSMIEVDNLDINDLDKMSTGGVREAVDRLHVKYDENMKQLIKDLRDRLQIKDNDPRDTVLKKVLAKVAYREARNKTKSKVGQEEIQAVRELTGDTFEGQELISLMRRMNELTDLHNSGYQGGISRITDSFSPLGSTIGYDKGQASFERLVRPIASISAGVYNPLVPLAQVGAVGAGRAIDALTGRRNRVQRYIKGNINNPGTDSSNFPSLREGAQQQLMTQQMMAENQQSDRQALQTNLYLNDAAPTPGSPQDIMQVSTGLDRDGLVRMATIIARTTPNETLRKAAESAAESIFTGGRVSDMSPLIREINRRLDNVKDLDVKRVQEPVRNYESQFNERPGYQRGINDNRQTVDDLIQGVNADDNLSPRDKALLTTALETMRKNLGVDPAGRVQEIADNTRAALDDPSAADVHLQPYVQRVQSQQRVQEDDLELNEMAVPRIGEGQGVFPVPPKLTEKVIGIYMDEGDYRAMPQNESVTGNTYEGGRIYIKENGTGGFEVDPQQSSEAPTKAYGKRFKTNLYKKFNTSKNGKPTLRLWNWVEQPEGNTRGENENEFLVAVVQGNDHFFTLQTEIDVPVELAKDQANINAGSQPYLRPQGFGNVVLGNKVGTIRNSSGKLHTIYDTIRIEPKEGAEVSMSQTPTFNQPLSNDPMRVSTRVPSGKNALSDPLSEDLQVNVEAIKAAPGNRNGTVFERMIDKVNAYPGMKGFMKNNKAKKDRAFIDFVKSNLLHLYNSVSEEYRNRARQWYAGANKLSQEAANKYGLTLPQVAGVMAVLSPQQDWYMNYDIGIRVIDTYLNQQDTVFGDAEAAAFEDFIQLQSDYITKAGKNPDVDNRIIDFRNDLDSIRGKSLSQLSSPTHKAMFVRFWDSVNNPNGGSHQVISPEGNLVGIRLNQDGTPSSIRFNSFDMVRKAIDIIENGSRETIHASLGERHKVRSFYNNILNPFSDRGDVTIDTHAVAAGLLRPLAGSDDEVKYNLGTMGDTSKATGTMGSYGLFADAYREAAEEVGVLPREMQSITWEAIRGLYTAGFKTPSNKRKINDIWNRYDNGDITLEETYGEIYELAGGINKAAWEESAPGSNPSASSSDETLSNNSGALLGIRGSGRPVRREDGRPAGGDPVGTSGSLFQTTDGSTNGDNGRSDGVELSLSSRPSLAGSRPASQEEVRAVQDSVVKAIFQVGKPGSPFENGVKDIRTVKAMVEAMGAMFVIGKNITEMDKIAGSRSPKDTFRKGFLLSPPGPNATRKGTIAVLDPDYVNPKDKRMTGGGPLGALFVALHETGHLLEKNYLSDAASLKGSENMGALYYSPVLERRTPGDQKSTIWTNTFRDTMNAMLTGVYEEKKAGTDGENTAIYNEIVNLQRNGALTMGDRTVPIRDAYEQAQYAVDNLGWPQNLVDLQMEDIEANYLQSPAEMAADAIGYYLFDPQGFKRMAPKTAALIQKSFKENRNVQFFAAPVGTVLAIILANMMIADREDEDEKAMLAQGRGALTA